MQKKVIKKIAIVGPESTGKSTLSKQLAEHFKVAWVPEYARYYCAALDRPCDLQDEVNMYLGQLALEDAIVSVAKEDFVICDTTFLTVKIWSDAMFGETPKIVLEELNQRPYDFYLLLDIDLPWEHDPLRDFPNQREHFMQIWHQELQALKANYVVVSGIENRLNNAIQAIEKFLKTL